MTGHFRISCNVPGVEVNALRATLGVRPMPFPVTGAIRGVLHCTGPLEQPVFTGTAVAIPPSAGMLEDCEDSQALDALRAAPGAVGAYDQLRVGGGESGRVPRSRAYHVHTPLMPRLAPELERRWQMLAFETRPPFLPPPLTRALPTRTAPPIALQGAVLGR